MHRIAVGRGERRAGENGGRPRSVPRRLLVAAALPLALLGCGGPDGAGEAPAAAAQPERAAIGDAPASGTGTAVLALEGEGLRVFAVPSGSARPIPFGTPMTEVVEMLAAVLGETPREEGEMDDCGVRYANWGNGLTTTFSGDRFAGWWVRDETGDLSTASGVGIGSTRAELEAAYQTDVEPSTLGIEFTAGGLAGILDSTRPDARITHLWAGNACLAR